MTHQLLFFRIAIRCLLVTLACCCATVLIASAQGPLVVPVSKPVQREVTDFADFTGRTEAAETVKIVPRVTGYVAKVAFTEGAEVKEGDLLFELEPQPYLAQLQLAESKLALSEAQLDFANKKLERTVELFKKKAVSMEELDQAKAERIQAEVQLKIAVVNRELAKMNLNHTKVTSPISGKVGQAVLTKGNVVHQFKTVLTTVIAMDPMYVSFDVDELTFLKLKKLVSDGTNPLPIENVPVSLGLQNEIGYPHKGTIKFVDGQINPATGAIKMRAAFSNKENGGPLLPGMFARVRLHLGPPYKALLVSDQAIQSDKGLKFVYVIDAKNKVQTRQVTTGQLQSDGLRVISKGLEPADWVVVGALKQVKPGLQVQMKATVMPAP